MEASQRINTKGSRVRREGDKGVRKQVVKRYTIFARLRALLQVVFDSHQSSIDANVTCDVGEICDKNKDTSLFFTVSFCAIY